MNARLIVTSVDIDMCSTVNKDVPDVNSIDKPALIDSELLSTNERKEDDAVLSSALDDHHSSTQHILSTEHVRNGSSCSVSVEKVNKLKLVHRGNCYYNEVR